MTSPTLSIPTSDVAPSADQNANALLDRVKWGGAVGTGAALTYSFPWAAPGSTAVFTGANGDSYSSLLEYTSGGALNSTEQGAAANALRAWGAVSNVTFQQLAETSTNVGDIRFAFTSVSDTSATGGVAWGWATLPDANAPAAGDIWITTYGAPAGTDWGAGSVNYESLLHEVGHALGLKHPFDGDVRLPADNDTEQYTVMSYTSAKHSTFFKVTDTPTGQSGELYEVHPDTPMLYDVAAMQYLYGANMSYHAGNDVYTFEPSTPFIRTIWDGGGNDTISVANFSLGTKIDLRAGQFSNITIPSASTAGFSFSGTAPTPTYDGTENLAIAYGVTIENAVGGAGADVIVGNAAANDLHGGGGNDTLDGAGGIDTASYTGKATNFIVKKTSSGFEVADSSLAEGKDTLLSVERVHFADPAAHTDSFLALDLNGNAGEVAKILGAVFGRDAVQHADYVGIGLSLADAGVPYADLVQYALTARGATTDKAIVDLLYFNIAGEQPTAQVESEYVSLLQNHSYTPGALGQMAAETLLNQSNIGLVALADHGLAYTPA